MATRFLNSGFITFGLAMLYPLLVVLVLLAILTYSPAGLLRGLGDSEILSAVKLSLLSAATATVCAILAGTPLAYHLARKEFRGRKIIETLVDTAVAIPPLVCGVGLLLLFGRNGWIGRHLAAIGISVVFSLKGAIIAQFFIATPLYVKTMQTAFMTIDSRFELVARTLGARPLRAFFKVTLPLSREGLLNGVTMSFARCLSEFGATLMLAGAIAYKTETLPLAVFMNMSTGDIDKAITAASILIFVSIVVIISMRGINSRFRKKVEYGI